MLNLVKEVEKTFALFLEIEIISKILLIKFREFSQTLTMYKSTKWFIRKCQLMVLDTFFANFLRPFLKKKRKTNKTK